MEQNIQVSETQSRNFFSNLQEQIQSNESSQSTNDDKQDQSNQSNNNDKQEQIELVRERGAIVIEQDVEREDFLNKINITQKNLGHNKLYQRIEELQKELEASKELYDNEVQKHKNIQKEQDMKLNLFKKTISTLQVQLQEKSAHILLLQNNLSTRSISESSQEQQSIDFENFRKEYEYIKSTLDKTTSERDIFLEKNNELRQHNQLLETSFQKQTRELQVQHEIVTKLENRINLEESVRLNLENEMFSLKNELAQYRTDIKNMTNSKDNEIQHLTAQLHNLLSKENSNDSETLNGSPSNIQQRNTQMSISNTCRGIKPSSSRGIKPTGIRGIKPTKI